MTKLSRTQDASGLGAQKARTRRRTEVRDGRELLVFRIFRNL